MADALATPEILRSAARGERIKSRRFQAALNWTVDYSLGLAALFSVFVTGAIIVILFRETWNFFGMKEVTLRGFFLSTEWSPFLGSTKSFGIWPLVCGTLLVAGVAMAVALPLGLITAVFLSEYAPRRVRAVLKPLLEILAGIPTVVYGFFALTVITPGLRLFHRKFFSFFLDQDFSTYNAASAGIAVGILCLPIVSSLCEDALRAVPKSLREGAFGLGGTKFDVTIKVVLPAALSGIVSALLLAISRAAGETMIVALAAGNSAKMTLDVREPVQTMTAFMVQVAKGDVSHESVEYLSLYAVAAMLFVMTFGLTIVGQFIRKRYREAYQ